MNNEKWNQYIKKSKEDYRKIGHVVCPALDNAPIYFNKYGWNHLLRKGRKFRDVKQLIWRLGLMNNVHKILSDSKYISAKRTTNTRGSIYVFWKINRKINGRVINVIVRKKNDGKHHFFSIF